jgi:hypothetical protein
MVEETLEFLENWTETLCTRRCSIPIPAVSRPTGLARCRDVHVRRDTCMEKVRPGTGREAGLGQAGGRATLEQFAGAGEGEAANRSIGWPGPCRERPVPSSDSCGCIASRCVTGMAEPLRVPPYVPAVPSSGEPRRVEPRSGFHHSAPPDDSTGEAMTRVGLRGDLPLTGCAGTPALRLEQDPRTTSAPRRLRIPPPLGMRLKYPGYAGSEHP